MIKKNHTNRWDKYQTNVEANLCRRQHPTKEHVAKNKVRNKTKQGHNKLVTGDGDKWVLE